MSWLFTSRWYQIKKDMNLKTGLVKGRRENVIPQTGKGRLPVVGVKNIKKRPTTDHLPHIKEKATSVRETMVKSTHDLQNASYRSSFQPKKLHDRFETIYRTYLSHKEKVISPWIPGPFLYIRNTDVHLHLGLVDTNTSGITVSLFHGYLINSHNFEMQIHKEANYITRNNIFDHIIFIS